MKQSELKKLQKKYRDQIRYTDKLLGKFLGQLKALSLFDQSLIIVTSDHGTSFDPVHPGRNIDSEETFRIPLIVKRPGQHDPRINDQPISNIDVSQIIKNTISQKGHAQEP